MHGISPKYNTVWVERKIARGGEERSHMAIGIRKRMNDDRSNDPQYRLPRDLPACPGGLVFGAAGSDHISTFRSSGLNFAAVDRWEMMTDDGLGLPL